MTEQDLYIKEEKDEVKPLFGCSENIEVVKLEQ